MHSQSAVPDVPSALQEKLDQRQYQRHELSRSAIVSIFGASSEVLRGEIQNVSHGGSQVRLRKPLRSGSLVRIEYDDNLILGEVVYCQQERANWLVGVRVEHALWGLTALAETLGEC
jgi:hypothetical protein